MLGIDVSSGTVERIGSNPHVNNPHNYSGARRPLEEMLPVCKNPELRDVVARHIAIGWRAINPGDRAGALLAIEARDHIESCEYCKALARSRAASA